MHYAKNFSYAGTWSDKYKDKDQRRSGSTTNQIPSSRDFLGDFLVWRPPTGLEKNRAFWVALTLWFGLVGAALLLQRWITQNRLSINVIVESWRVHLIIYCALLISCYRMYHVCMKQKVVFLQSPWATSIFHIW